jgi:hypothetical protein
MMLETTIAHGRSAAEWSHPPSSSKRTPRRRRNSKVVYHANNSRCSPPRNVRSGSGSTLENLPVRQMDSEYFNNAPNNGTFEYSPVIHQGSGNGSQNGPGNSSWQQSSSLVSYTLGSNNGANSPTRFFDGNGKSAPSPQSGLYLQLSNSDLGSSWNGASNELEDMSMLDIPYGSYDDSLGLSSPTTAGTSSSEGFVFPVIDTALGSSPGANQLFDLDLSGR